MTTRNSNLTPSAAANAATPSEAPLKAERIQWILLGFDLGNRPYDFTRETKAERSARLDAGWRKRITTSGRPGRKLDAA